VFVGLVVAPYCCSSNEVITNSSSHYCTFIHSYAHGNGMVCHMIYGMVLVVCW
jgi:hypothetical protein